MASALLGAAAGALIAGRIADHIGRLMVMRIAAILFFISAIGTGFARTLVCWCCSGSSAVSASASPR